MKNPLRKLHRPYHVNYLQGFWLKLLKDCLKKLKGWAAKRDHTITIKIRWVVAALILLALWPHPQRIVYGDPLSPAPIVHKVKLIKPMPQTDLQPTQTPLEPVPVYVPPPPPAPAPVASTGGCQTYWSGDYYLDNIIRFESGGNSCATNLGDCFGLLQACPGAPLRDACGGSPACQIAWFQQYKTGGRSWAQVWQHELDFGWW